MAVAEILCHEITEGDIRKINAISNDADTGGGARDLRFSIDFAPCLDRLFPKEVTQGRTPYRVGTFEHIDAKGRRTTCNVMYAFKPTKARPGEVRIAQINKVPFFSDIPKIHGADGLLFICFIRRTNGIPLAQYLTEKQMGSEESNQLIAGAMRSAIRKKRGNNAVVFSVRLG
jgi:hypothetical protein